MAPGDHGNGTGGEAGGDPENDDAGDPTNDAEREAGGGSKNDAESEAGGGSERGVESDAETRTESEPDRDTGGVTGTYSEIDAGGHPETDDETDPDDRARTDADRPDSSWLSETWYGSTVGVGIVLFDVALTLALVAVTTREWESAVDGLADVPLGVIPWYVYAFSVLGALGYVFTALVRDFDRETGEVLRYNLRLPAALPLGGGIFLLSEIVLGEASQAGPLVVGTAFLAGLYVNLAYERLGALAERLL